MVFSHLTWSLLWNNDDRETLWLPATSGFWLGTPNEWINMFFSTFFSSISNDDTAYNGYSFIVFCSSCLNTAYSTFVTFHQHRTTSDHKCKCQLYHSGNSTQQWLIPANKPAKQQITWIADHLPDSIKKPSYSWPGSFLGGRDFTACAIALLYHTHRHTMPSQTDRLCWFYCNIILFSNFLDSMLHSFQFECLAIVMLHRKCWEYSNSALPVSCSHYFTDKILQDAMLHLCMSIDIVMWDAQQ